MNEEVQQDLYVLLELDPGATDDEIRRAYKKLTTLFDPTGPVMYGLYSQREALRLARKLREAYETLMDPEKRRNYDRSVYPEGHPSLRRADERVAAAPPRPRAELPADPLGALGLPPETPLLGTVIARVRQICNLTLEDIADRTKISMFTLRCIERDAYADLPAPVYLRGFVRQIATLLRLDGDRAVVDYMEAFDAWRAEEARRKPW